MFVPGGLAAKLYQLRNRAAFFSACKKLLLIFSLSLVCAACSTFASSSSNKAAAPEAILQQSGVKILQMGDNIRYVVPSALLFSHFSHHFNAKAYPILNAIITQIKVEPKVSVTVGAYLFASQNPSLAEKITRQQAQRVRQYLISHGADARLIYAFGMGQNRQVTHLTQKQLNNYRVEITFQRMHVRIAG